MLWLYRFLLCSLSCVVLCISTSNAHVVYGDHQLHRKHQKGTYIQVGAFRIKHNAITKKQHVLRRHPTYFVTIHHHHNGYYVVLAKPRHTHAHSRYHPRHHVRHAHRDIRHITQENRVGMSAWSDRAIRHIQSSSGFLGVQGATLWPILPNNIQVNNGSGYAYPLNMDTYFTHDDVQGAIGFVVGRMWKRNTTWMPYYSIGGRYQHIFSGNITGNIAQYSLPEFENYAYSWSVAINTLTAFLKVDLVEYAKTLPYLEGGLGVSFNQAQNYLETPYPGVPPRISPNYGPSSHASFAYHFGAGLDFKVFDSCTASLGYEYQNLGKVNSGTGQGINWGAQRLALGNYQANTLLVRLSYIFD